MEMRLKKGPFGGVKEQVVRNGLCKLDNSLVTYKSNITSYFVVVVFVFRSGSCQPQASGLVG